MSDASYGELQLENILDPRLDNFVGSKNLLNYLESRGYPVIKQVYTLKQREWILEEVLMSMDSASDQVGNVISKGKHKEYKFVVNGDMYLENNYSVFLPDITSLAFPRTIEKGRFHDHINRLKGRISSGLISVNFDKSFDRDTYSLYMGHAPAWLKNYVGWDEEADVLVGRFGSANSLKKTEKIARRLIWKYIWNKDKLDMEFSRIDKKPPIDYPSRRIILKGLGLE